MQAPKQKISALIITYNEIEHIKKCVDSISFADEIIVVDSYSSDGTFEFLEQDNRVKAIQHPFNNFTEQKSFALSQASNKWVLFVDADEIIDKKLRLEILSTVDHPEAKEAYYFYRQFMFKNKKLRFSGWQTDKNHRLFQKDKVSFTKGKIVHETLDIEGTSGCLKEKLAHYSYKNYSEYRSKMLLYGKLRAYEQFRKGKRFNYLKLLFKPGWKFLFNFICRLGFLDLGKGLTICYLDALSVYARYAELQRLEKATYDGSKIGQLNEKVVPEFS